MSVIVEKSVCVDCKGKTTCQRLKRLSPGKTISEEQDEIKDKIKNGGTDDSLNLSIIDSYYRKRPKEVFEMIIVDCSIKIQYDERERFAKKEN